MTIWGKLAAAMLLPSLLSGCLWGPGKFTSSLALNKAGTFVLDYRGEILLQMPDEKDVTAKPWEDKMALCYKDGRAERAEQAVMIDLGADEAELPEGAGNVRPCTSEELARLKKEHDAREAERVARKQAESEQMARLFGLPGSDDASNHRFAANLTKHKGWRSATYKGKGVFDVDYHFEGRLDQDYAFPLMPDTDLMIPFITIRPRTDGSVKVSAPALVGGAGVLSARAKAMGLPDKGSDGPASRAEGRFTITTDGEILTNNSEDGPVAGQGRRAVHWDVGAGSQRVPEMMVKL